MMTIFLPPLERTIAVTESSISSLFRPKRRACHRVRFTFMYPLESSQHLRVWTD
jgi:hypothetical protein